MLIAFFGRKIPDIDLYLTLTLLISPPPLPAACAHPLLPTQEEASSACYAQVLNDVMSMPQGIEHKLEVVLETCAAMLDVGTGLRTSSTAVADKLDRLERKLDFFSRSRASENTRGASNDDVMPCQFWSKQQPALRKRSLHAVSCAAPLLISVSTDT